MDLTNLQPTTPFGGYAAGGVPGEPDELGQRESARAVLSAMLETPADPGSASAGGGGINLQSPAPRLKTCCQNVGDSLPAVVGTHSRVAMSGGDLIHKVLIEVHCCGEFLIHLDDEGVVVELSADNCGECLAGFGPTCPIRCSMASLSLGAQVTGTGLEPVERVRATRHCHCIQSTRTKIADPYPVTFQANWD